MAQYQSFPDAAGDSRTLEKLKALRLPALDGRSFLDVGCNEGFFCGFASFAGAARSVGIDYSADFIYRAKTRFPQCEFYHQTWERLPEGSFDVILLASALHYADDQPALIKRLVDHLAPDGLLVLEIGVVSSPQAEWIKVKRGIDERYFPTMPQLKRTLADYAWKWMGKSVNQDGDPVPRHVVHVSRRRPVAYLLMQPPAYGKSSLASRLFPPAAVPIVSGDQVIQDIAQGKLGATERLQALITEDFDPFAIDKLVQRIFAKKLGADLVKVWLDSAGRGDFAMDGFVPQKHHTEVAEQLAAAGYLPIIWHWERVSASSIPVDSMNGQAESFYKSISGDGVPDAVAELKPGARVTAGYVDELFIENGHVVIRGWAIDEGGQAPQQLVVGIGPERTFVDVGTAHARKDVQRHLELDHAMVGYKIAMPIGAVHTLADLGRLGFSISLTSGRPLRIAGSVVRLLGADAPD
jgi:SAM-dependent methyltransferase